MPSTSHLSLVLRTARLTEPHFQRAKAYTTIGFSQRNPSRQRHFRHESSTSFERYGPAREIPPPLDMPEPNSSTAAKGNSEKDKDTDTKSEGKADGDIDPKKTVKVSPSKLQDAVTLDAAEGHPKESIPSPHLEPSSQPLEKVLHMPAPTSVKKPPHLEATSYVHHFDTYTLVKHLQNSGFTKDQSITLMKAVRLLLAVNLDLARASLVSKSALENDSYLFRAACSELRTEIQQARRLNAERMRGGTAALQNEVETLGRKVAQETMTLKDELRGLFDDWKMAARMDQRKADNKIQEIHYRITSAMTGEAKGEVEGLRWYLTRLLVFTMAGTAMAGVILVSWYTRRAHKEQERLKREASLLAATNQFSGTSSTTQTIPARSMDTQTAQTEAVLAEVAAGSGKDGSADTGYVSLG